MQSLVRGAISGALGLTETVLATSLEVVRLINVAIAEPGVSPAPAPRAQSTPAPVVRTPSWRPPETGDLEHTADVLKERARVRPPRASLRASRGTGAPGAPGTPGTPGTGLADGSADGSAAGGPARRRPPPRPRAKPADE